MQWVGENLTSADSDEPLQPPLSLETPNGVQSVAYQSQNTQATSKVSDQTVRMHVGHVYHVINC